MVAVGERPKDWPIFNAAPPNEINLYNCQFIPSKVNIKDINQSGLTGYFLRTPYDELGGVTLALGGSCRISRARVPWCAVRPGTVGSFEWHVTIPAVGAARSPVPVGLLDGPFLWTVRSC